MSSAREKVWFVYELAAGGQRNRLGSLDPGGEPMEIGRSEKCDISVGRYDLGVSRCHLKVALKGTTVRVENRGKGAVERENGGKQIPIGGTARLRNGEILRLSGIRLEFSLEEIATSAFVEIMVGEKVVRKSRVEAKELILGAGRRPLTDLRVRAEGVSRQHLALRRNDEGIFCVRDLGSRNGVFVRRGKSEGMERVEEAFLEIGDQFSFGSAVGAFRTGKIHEGSKVKLYLLAGVMVFAFLLLLLVGGKDDPPPPVFDLAAFKEVWLSDGMDRDERLGRVEAFLDASGGAEFPQKPSLAKIVEALSLEKSISESISRLERSHALTVQAVRESPWEPGAYRLSHQVDIVLTDKYADRLESAINSLVEDTTVLDLPLGRLDDPFDKAIAGRWRATVEEAKELELALVRSASILRDWRDRSWFPLPTETDIEEWKHLAEAIDPRLAESTTVEIRRYNDAMVGAEAYWRGVDGWVLARVQGREASFPEWAPPSFNSAEGPFSVFALHASPGLTGRMAEIAGEIGGVEGILPVLPGLVAMSESIPPAWRDKTLKLAGEVDEKVGVIRAQINDLLDRLYELGGAEKAPLDSAEALFLEEGSKLPRLNVSESLEKEFESLSSLRLAAKQAQSACIVIAERIHSDISSGRADLDRAKIVKSLVWLPFMEANDSNRRESLFVWAKETLEKN